MISVCVLTNEYSHYYTNFDYLQTNMRQLLGPFVQF